MAESMVATAVPFLTLRRPLLQWPATMIPRTSPTSHGAATSVVRSKISKRAVFIVILSIGLLLFLRESGLIQLNWYSSRIEGASTVNRRTMADGQQIPIDVSRISVPNEPGDRMPFRKTRKVEGHAKVEHPDGSWVEYSYTYSIVVTGLCTADKFRDIILAKIKEDLIGK